MSDSVSISEGRKGPQAPPDARLNRAEALMVAERRRIAGLALEALLAPVDRVLRTHRLSAIPDIFDRLIAAEAVERNEPLLTRDPVIRDSQLVTTV